MTSLLSDRVNRQTDRQTDRLMTDTGENIISSAERETCCKKIGRRVCGLCQILRTVTVAIVMNSNHTALCDFLRKISNGIIRNKNCLDLLTFNDLDL